MSVIATLSTELTALTKRVTSLETSRIADETAIVALKTRLTKDESMIAAMTSSGPSAPDRFVYIVSSAYASLPSPGNRVGPSDAANMPKIVSPNTTSAIATASGAHHYRFVGIDIKPTASTFIVNLVSIGNAETSLTNLPHDITFDRCLIRGDSTVGGRRGVAMNGASIAVIDSYTDDFKEAGADSQALWAGNSPGPLKIVNNYLVGAGENMMFGGQDPNITNLVQSDIEIRRNHFFKPLSWRGSSWTIKNVLEFKNAQRVLTEGNIFENIWASGQQGFWLTITPRNQDGFSPWTVTKDITVRLNKCINCSQGAVLQGTDDLATSQLTQRVLIENNQMDLTRISDSTLSQGALAQIFPRGITTLTIRHNTALITAVISDPARFGNVDVLPKGDHFDFNDNIVNEAFWGFFGSGAGSGTVALDAYFTNYTFTKNGIVAGFYTYPAGNLFPASYAACDFVDYAGGNWKLNTTSPLHNAASDGTDIGADIDAMNAAILHTVGGQWGSEPPTYSGSGTIAEFPRAFLDTTYRPQSGSTLTVHSGENLQTALNSANLGDTIVVDAGATFTGNFTLPVK